MKRTVEINDSLPDILSALQDDTRDVLARWLHDNMKQEAIDGETIDTPCISNDLDYSGSIHELIDGAVPVYYHEIDGLWYLYKNEFIEAYEGAGIGEEPTENSGMAAIYCYLEQGLHDWYRSNSEAMTAAICADIKANEVSA